MKYEYFNIRNFENIVLFLIFCFEYIFFGVVFNVGVLFRECVVYNCKFISIRYLDFFWVLVYI